MTKKKAEIPTTEISSKKRKVSFKGARAKGLQFERDVANALGHIFPEAKRQLEYQADECNGVDIHGTGIFKFQCKNKQNYVPINTINEIKTKDQFDIPVLVTKGNKMEPMAVLPFEKFVTLLEMACGLKPQINAGRLREKEEAVYITASEIEVKMAGEGAKIRNEMIKPFIPLIDLMVEEAKKIGTETQIEDLV